ncbi:unnamed protein product, partial [Musa acuminata var. zebrina]
YKCLLCRGRVGCGCAYQILVSSLCCSLGALIVSALAPIALQLEISLFKRLDVALMKDFGYWNLME